MKMRWWIAAVCALAASQVHAESIRTEADVRALLREAGYSAVVGVELDRGAWRAEAVDEDGNRVEVEVDPVTADIDAQVLDPTPMTASDVRSVLSSAGYHRIRDLRYADGTWHARARDRFGVERDVSLDEDGGRVVEFEDDF